MVNPAFSIIILCDKDADLLNNTLQSIISQNYENWECLIVSSISDIEKEFKTDNRIKIRVEKNLNRGFKKNIGIQNSSGNYLIFMDEGDYFENENSLSSLISKIEPRDELIYTDLNIEKRSGKNTIFPISIEYIIKQTYPDYFFVFNKSIFQKNKPYREDLDYLTEWEFIVRIISLGRVKQLYLSQIVICGKPEEKRSDNKPIEKEKDKILCDLFSLEFLEMCRTHSKYKSFYFKKKFEIFRKIKRVLSFLFSPTKLNEYVYKKRMMPVIRLFNKTIRMQEKDTSLIPIIIINFNRLADLEKLVSFLIKRKHKNIVIVDNGSTYPPLLEYYEKIKKDVVIKIMDYNYGHLVFWQNEELNKQYSQGYHIVTDFDIIPNDNLPEDYIQQLINILNNHKNITKVGFALRIDDLPQERIGVIPWEKPFWEKPIEKDLYVAGIDTTFALYPPKYKFNFSTFYNAIRVGGNFTARHGGFYIVDSNLSEEDLYYFQSANASSTWKGYAKTEDQEKE